ncbi:MAG: MetS family NSS transporter small subunit [Desulfobacter sp.]|nr:MAG: MetS family NSS transporter small subunit [Desulfobacter sp.]
MTTSALIMMVIGLGVTWGGAAACIAIAIKKKEI